LWAWAGVSLAASEPLPRPATKTFVYKKTNQADLEMVVHFPPGWKSSDKRPAIVFFFGGGWTGGRITQFEPQAAYLAERGMVACRADYRVKSRHGVTPKECVQDAKSAIRWVRENAGKLGVDPKRIVGAGGSAGGHIAACAALTPGVEPEGENLSISSRPDALVLFNPVLRFSGIPQLIERIGNDESLAKAISPTLHLTKDSPPSLLLFGTADRLLAQGNEFMEKSKRVGHRAELFLAEGQGHGFFNRAPWLERTTQRMAEFLSSLGYCPAPGQPSISSDKRPKAAEPQYPRAELLLEPAELARPDVARQFVVLDARERKQYEAGRIPGAVWVDAADWAKAFKDGQDAHGWSARIGALGIRQDAKVVVYDQVSFRDAARIWWILKFWGVPDVRLLNGNWQGWSKAGLPLETGKPKAPTPVPFAAQPVPTRLATKRLVLQSLNRGGLQLVDARTEKEFCGLDPGKNKRAGAIPGAKHLDWSDLVDKDTQRFKPAAELRKLFQQVGIDLERPSATYCQSGGRASVMAFGMELMGARQVSNYYGSWAEWGNDPDTPIVRSASEKAPKLPAKPRAPAQVR